MQVHQGHPKVWRVQDLQGEPLSRIFLKHPSHRAQSCRLLAHHDCSVTYVATSALIVLKGQQDINISITIQRLRMAASDCSNKAVHCWWQVRLHQQAGRHFSGTVPYMWVTAVCLIAAVQSVICSGLTAML